MNIPWRPDFFIIWTGTCCSSFRINNDKWRWNVRRSATLEARRSLGRMAWTTSILRGAFNYSFRSSGSVFYFGTHVGCKSHECGQGEFSVGGEGRGGWCSFSGNIGSLKEWSSQRNAAKEEWCDSWGLVYDSLHITYSAERYSPRRNVNCDLSACG